MKTSFCLAALHEAVKRTGKTPEIINTDQGCQHTSAEWIAAVESYGES
jgi:transposase InsO family protein